MNIIWIVTDSFRYDHVGANGNTWMKTPNLDAFARKSLVFDRAFQLSFPTLPTRTDLFTGRYTFPRRGWSSLDPSEVTAAQRFKQAGMTTQMIFDTYHLMNVQRNFNRGFDGWIWTRGQEADSLLPKQEMKDVLVHPTRPDIRLHPFGANGRELSNMRHRRFESEYISPQTYTKAEEWLEHSYDKGPFFLYVDSFDPHEPWDPPAHYVTLYDPHYSGEVICHPPFYGFADEFPEGQVEKMKLLYAGEATMVDRWMGRLLQKIEDLKLFENTLVLVMSDHGFLIGDNGRVGKSNRDWKRRIPDTGDERYKHPWPFFRTVNQMNLMIHIPGMKEGRRTKAIVQPHDFLPTALEWLGAETPAEIEGRSFLRVLRGEADRHRDFAITSFALPENRDAHEASSTVTDGRWALHFSTREGETALHDLEGTGGEEANVVKDHADVARDLHAGFYETIVDKVSHPIKAELVKRLPK